MRRLLGSVWLPVALSFAALYLFTCQRTVGWQDSGRYQLRVREADFFGDLGIALAHPTYIAAAQVLKAIPVGTLEWRLNAFSGLGAAVMVANVALLCAVVFGSRRIAFLVAALLGVSHAVWWLATVAEVYTWSTAAFSAELVVLARILRAPSARSIGVLALVNGLGVSVHNVGLLPLPYYVALVTWLVARRQVPATAFGWAAFAWTAGASPLLVIVSIEALRSGVGPAIHSALFGKFQGAVLALVPNWSFFKLNMAMSSLSLISLLPPLAMLGALRLRNELGRPLALGLAVIGFVQFGFFVRYPVVDQFTFVLPSLVVVAILSAAGLRSLDKAYPRRTAAHIAVCLALVVAAPTTYAVIPAVVEWSGVYSGRTRERPFRDEVRYWIVPWKHAERSAEQFAEHALRAAAPDGVVFADSTALPALHLMQRRMPTTGRVDIRDFARAPWEEVASSFAARDLATYREFYVVSPVQRYLHAWAANGAVFVPTDGHVLFRVATQ